MQVDRISRGNCVSLPASILGILVWGCLVPSPAFTQNLQDDIDQASPGDTVWIEAGDYVRGITVDKAITLVPRTPGTVRLASLSGSRATVAGIHFDGSLDSKVITLVTAGSGLSVRDCIFSGTVRGALVEASADGVVLDDCTFTNLIEGLSLEAGVVSLEVSGTEFVNCSLGLSGPDTLECPESPPRQAAQRCSGGCGTVTVTDVLFSRGDRHITLSGNHVLRLVNTRLQEPTDTSISGKGIRLEIEDCEIASVGGTGVGFDLQSVSGYIRRSRILSWDTALRIGDGSCPLYSDIVVGGSKEEANDIGSQTLSLDLDQPEAIDAEVNFWGSTDCDVVHTRIDGQTVDQITDISHVQVFRCAGTPIEPATWGLLKTRFPRATPVNRR